MLIVTTILCVEQETAKQLDAVETSDSARDERIPVDDREFLGIYQGMNRVEPQGQE